MKSFTEESLLASIREAITAETNKAIAEEAARAERLVGERVRRAIPGIVMSVLDHYSVRQMGSTLIVEVKHRGDGG